MSASIEQVNKADKLDKVKKNVGDRTIKRDINMIRERQKRLAEENMKILQAAMNR